MAARMLPLRDRVEFSHDGAVLPAERGEPLALSLIAEGRVALSRSPKLHRPRGPYCLRAACDGCSLRVDGVPNVLACRHRVRGGERVETQNVLGSRKLDLLAVNDFLFPHGIDHHRLLAGVPGVSKIVALAARRIAGLGRLPDAARPVSPAQSEARDVVVVGGGRAGLEAAQRFGARALVVEDESTFGGALALLDPAHARTLEASARAAGAELRASACAAGLYRDAAGRLGLLLASEQRIDLVFAESVVLAMGGHDATPDFAACDLPGILSARAGLALLRAGIFPGERVAVVGNGRFAKTACELLGSRLVAHIEDARRVEAAEGRSRVSALRVTEFLSSAEAPRGANSSKKIKLDTLLFDAQEAPAFELAVQAGATTRFDPARGYLPLLDGEGRAADGVFCVGSLSGRESALGSR